VFFEQLLNLQNSGFDTESETTASSLMANTETTFDAMETTTSSSQEKETNSIWDYDDDW